MISDEIALRLLSLITIESLSIQYGQSFLVFKRAVFLPRSLNTLFQLIYHLSFYRGTLFTFKEIATCNHLDSKLMLTFVNNKNI